MIAELTTPPADTPVSLAEMRAHLRVTSVSEDALIQDCLAAATALLDGVHGVTGRALMRQEWREAFPGFSPWPALALWPAPTLVEIGYIDPDGAAQTATLGDFEIVSTPLAALVRPKSGVSLPATACRPDAVTVRYEVGYADAASVPAPLRAAVKLLAAHLFEQRQPVAVGTIAAELPIGVMRLVHGYRRIRV